MRTGDRTPSGRLVSVERAKDIGLTSGNYFVTNDAGQRLAITWYDRQQRHWVTYAVNSQGFQISDSTYAPDFAEALRDLDGAVWSAYPEEAE